MNDVYCSFAAGVQALRRRVEALTYGCGGALGVAADPYPHQIASISRILTDIRIRHLISDEVGLGKTVETLMIINALRWQNRSHRTVVIVPDRLVSQWQDEAWTRGHIRAAVPDDIDGEERIEDPVMYIVRPQSIQDGSFVLDPVKYDLLIVDEPQTFPIDVLDSLERKCDQFRQVLLLSATPRLGDPGWLKRFMAFLEPERSALAKFEEIDVDTFLNSIENDAISSEGDNFQGLSDERAEAIYRTCSRERRILREKRRDWGRYLPERKEFMVSVEPLKEERERFNLARRVIEENETAIDMRFYPWTVIKGLQRSRRSARAALDTISDREDNLRTEVDVARTALDNPGDSRFEALLDVLSEIWLERDSEKVIVVAGDNPTIDLLRIALTRYFPALGSDEEISVLRRTANALESEASEIERMTIDLAGFTQGKSRILLIGEWIQAGLNLHYFARNIVFYSPPWAPDAIDQLIGRIDRLRPNGLYKGDKGTHFGHIRIWHLYMESTSEAHVAAGLNALGVFNRPLPPITEPEGMEINKLLVQLASGHNVRSALSELSSIACRWDDNRVHSALECFSPYHPACAQKYYSAFQAERHVEPAMLTTNGDKRLTSRIEAAIRGWTNFLSAGRFFAIAGRRDHQNSKSSFSTFWYMKRNSPSPFEVAEIETGNWMTDHVPFIYRRRDMGSPPRKLVHTDDGEPEGRLLRFLDHGDDVHDSLVEGFIKFSDRIFNGENSNECHVVTFPMGHPALEFSGDILLLSVCMTDTGVVLLPKLDNSEMQRIIDDAPTKKQVELLQQDLSRANELWRADQRWIRSFFCSSLDVRVSRLNTGNWQEIDNHKKWDIFKPLGPDGELKPCPSSRKIDITAPTATGRKGHLISMIDELKATCQDSRRTFVGALEIRKECVKTEGNDLIRLRTEQYNRRMSEKDKFSKEQFWRGQVEAAERSLNMARLMLDRQIKYLEEIPERVLEPRPERYWSLLLKPAPMDI